MKALKKMIETGFKNMKNLVKEPRLNAYSTFSTCLQKQCFCFFFGKDQKFFHKCKKLKTTRYKIAVKYSKNVRYKNIYNTKNNFGELQ